MYSTEIDGETTEFGTSGMLYRSNKLMYDRATETLWHQFRGEPVVGPLAGSGIRLKVLPSVLTTWVEWLAEHPDTTVISNDTGVYPADFYRPEEHTRSIYYSYRADPGTMFPVAGIDDRLDIKAQVFGLTFDGEARAYLRSDLAQTLVLNDTVGRTGRCHHHRRRRWSSRLRPRRPGISVRPRWRSQGRPGPSVARP